MKYQVLILFIFSFIINCASGFDAKKKLFSTNQVAIYSVPRKHIKDFKLIQGEFKHPVQLTKSKLTDIIGNLTFRETTKLGDYEDYLFNLNDLHEMNEVLSVAFENSKPEFCILGIVQFQDYKSVISDNKRTTFITWVDESGLNLAFGEMKTVLPREVSRNFYEWTFIRDFDLDNREVFSQFFKESDFFEFKKINGYPRKKWLVFSLNDLEKYKLRPRDLNINYKPNPE